MAAPMCGSSLAGAPRVLGMNLETQGLFLRSYSSWGVYGGLFMGVSLWGVVDGGYSLIPC